MKAVNLLPSDIRGAAKPAAEAVVNVAKGGAGPFVVLAVLAACVVGLAGYVLAGNTVKDRKAELAQVSVRQQALNAKVAELKPYADFDDMARSRVKTVRDLAGSRFDWEQVLSDVSRAIPADITLNKLTGDVSTDAGSGGSALRSAITAPAITLTGCAPGQLEVARLMSRMRDVDGVTRVSLSKSDSQSVQAQSGGGTNERELRNARPCGTGLRPNFEIVLFFENVPAAVKASPDPNSSTSTPAASATPTPTATPSTATSATTAPAQGGATP
jgi:Tfp pilus assembly protein PilN